MNHYAFILGERVLLEVRAKSRNEAINKALNLSITEQVISKEANETPTDFMTKLHACVYNGWHFQKGMVKEYAIA